MDDLDRAIAAYSNQEPPLGLEARVLRRVQKRKAGWLWVPALVAAGVCLALLLPERKVRTPVAPATQSVAVAPVVQTQVKTLAAKIRRAQAPKPLQPSEQQLELIRLVQNFPELATHLHEETKDLTIPALTIEPIVITELGEIE